MVGNNSQRYSGYYYAHSLDITREISSTRLFQIYGCGGRVAYVARVYESDLVISYHNMFVDRYHYYNNIIIQGD